MTLFPRSIERGPIEAAGETSVVRGSRLFPLSNSNTAPPTNPKSKIAGSPNPLQFSSPKSRRPEKQGLRYELSFPRAYGRGPIESKPVVSAQWLVARFPRSTQHSPALQSKIPNIRNLKSKIPSGPSFRFSIDDCRFVALFKQISHTGETPVPRFPRSLCSTGLGTRRSL